MKTCNNCGSSNEDHVSQCGHCNMVGQFTYQGGEQVKAAPTPANIQCKNCGSEDPGEGKKCVHCHFPLPIPSSAESSADYPKLSVQNNLRAS
ncbi:MAG: hypothetical protein KTR30_01775 [Saprospiraceae bacterium]|nr:hypothetical protein [Saprospiraceae bacterium]